MDEIKRRLEVLGLKPGATEDEVKKAYRELVMVWHPDRFASDSPMQARAETKLKELNAAYEFLLAHGFHDGLDIIPEQTFPETDAATSPPVASPPEESDEQPAGSGKSIWIILALLLATGLTWWWFQHKTKVSSQEAVQTRAPKVQNLATDVVANPIPAPAPPKTAAVPVSNDNLLPIMRAGDGSTISTSDEGTVITGNGWLHTQEEYSPPFVIRAVAKTDLTNIRLIYGQGVVIFNWELNPGELRFHDPITGNESGVAGKGRVPINEWQDIEWRVETNSISIRVNGTERAKFSGNYTGMTDLAGIKTALGATVTVREFEVRKLASDIPRKLPGPNAGLVLYFPFEADENGIVTDQSGCRNNGTVRGAKFTREGKVGGAMLFSGNSTAGDSIVVPNSATLISMQRTRQLTVCAWIKPNSLASEFPVILAKGGNFQPKAYGGYEMILHASGENGLHFNSGKYWLVCFQGGDLWFPKHLNEWTHVAVVVNTAAGTGKFYVNGERADDYCFGRNTRDCNFLLSNDLVIGGPDLNHHSNRAWFDGLIDEVRIYARALTAEEIRDLPGFSRTNP